MPDQDQKNRRSTESTRRDCNALLKRAVEVLRDVYPELNESVFVTEPTAEDRAAFAKLKGVGRNVIRGRERATS